MPRYESNQFPVKSRETLTKDTLCTLTYISPVSGLELPVTDPLPLWRCKQEKRTLRMMGYIDENFRIHRHG